MSSRASSPLFLFCAGFGVCAGLGALTAATRAPMIFPSLGASTFILFHAPTVPAAAPRNAILGHGIALLAGFASLALFGLLDQPPDAPAALGWPRILAVGTALGLTCALKAAWGVIHPPGGATTMIVALGLLPSLWQMPMAMVAVVLLVTCAALVHRARGEAYPLWGPNGPRP